MPDTRTHDSAESLRAEVQRLQQLLRAATDGFKAVFDHAPYSMTIIDFHNDGSFQHVRSNPAALRMLGIAGTGGNTAEPQFSEETRAKVYANFVACRDSGQPLKVVESLNVGGREIWTQAVYSPSPLPDGSGTRILITTFDITAQKLQEQEAVREREAIIEQQSLTLAELSTPLLTISDDVVVLPLIGTIDSRRAQQIMEALLSGIAETRARIAILDITGVAVVDTQVANVLIRAAQAVNLLGARVVLTGIRPEVAQTLVGLGIDLGKIVTRSTLQAGIAYSLE
jgi:anti-anti-sigma factor